VSAVRVTGHPGGAGDFVVASASVPGRAWCVTWVSEGAAWCPCPGFGWRRWCRHARAAQEAVVAEARALTAAGTTGSRQAAADALAALEEMFS